MSKINISSVGMSVFNPANSWKALLYNGAVSNTFQYSVEDGFRLGTGNEIVSGTVLEVGFGMFTGKTKGGVFSQSDKYKAFAEGFSKESGSIPTLQLKTGANELSFFFNNAKKIRLNEAAQLNFNISKALQYTDFSISTFGQTGKNVTFSTINQ